MVNLTLAVPNDLKSKMEVFTEINWSAVAREAFSEKINELEFVKHFKSKSNFTEKDALKFGKELSKNLAKRRL